MRRRGFVLVVVLFALVLLSALASAGFFEALQEMRIGRNSAQDVALQNAAESGIAAALASWDPRLTDALDVGRTVRLPGAGLAGAFGFVDARRLADRLLLLRSSATDARGTARVVETIARLSAVEVPAAAVRARSADAGARAAVDGADRSPPGWICPALHDNAVGLVLMPAASDSALFRFGSMDWPALAAWAASVPAGGDSLGVTYQRADTALNGGRWTGTLVVGGDLVLRGGVEVVGLVIVRQALVIDAGGAAILGSVVASQVVVNQSVSSQQVVFGYSSCSASRSGLSRARPAPLPGVPSWGVY